MNKTIILTPNQVKLIKDDIHSTKHYLDIQLSDDPDTGPSWCPQDRERAIHDVNDCEDILKKLGDD